MDRDGFRHVLQDRGMPEDKIDAAIAVAEGFEAFVSESRRPGALGPATAEEVRAFSQVMIREGLNTYDNYVALARYGRFAGNDEVCAAVLVLVDGSEALETLHKKLGRAVGRKKRDQVFDGIPLPALGTPPTDLPRITQAVMERLEALVDPAVCRQILSGGLRHLESKWFLKERKRYRKCKDIDAYLELRHREYVAELEQLKAEGRLYFTQEVTDEMLDLVRGNPEIEAGVRQGNILYHTKIPHMAKEYLAETDDRMKRYYYCHCPWVKESLRAGDVRVSPTFCHCSAGFVKKPWEVILGQPLEADVLESVLTGSRWCRFAIHLPEEAVPEARSSG
jgi:hypothetical protein